MKDCRNAENSGVISQSKDNIRKIGKGMALTHMHSQNYSKDTARLDGLVEHAGYSVALELLEGTQDPQLTRSNRHS